jgi:hypothetical protein
MLNCDELVRTEIDTVADAVASAVASAPAIAAAAAAAEAALKKSKKEKKKLKSVAGVPVVSKDNKGNNVFTFHILPFKLACFFFYRVSPISPLFSDWCNEMKNKFKVVPMRSWGSLPLNHIDSWKDRKCDLVFTAERMGSKVLSFCPNEFNTSSTDSGKLYAFSLLTFYSSFYSWLE